ncbi:MAG TPA: exodeoxyribonuclease VII large subunit [Rhizomicrobium sp.]|jgi:exodeoxyribonuclease VII large subunit|nr:exodeoxyribonuclease VII large subunit [Rhizomicrobium sp.]
MSEAAAKPNLPEFSVSEIAGLLKRTVEDAFPFVRVRGEISGLKFASSGHVYFDLKDDKAVLNAIIWKQTARLLKLRPEQGLDVVCTGRITTYPGTSRYQIIVEQIELAGVGALMAMLEDRKKKLAAEGLFDAAHKKPLPFLPEIVGVITSPTGAVIRDIMHRLNDRFPRRVLLWPVAVQGDKAAAEVAAAIAGFNTFGSGKLPKPDVLIVARGGGSIEDLMAFNEEIVVRAAFASTIPLISAVGHETDTTLIDFVSDRRAPTPTAAAEMAVPLRSELVGQVTDFERRTLRCFTKGMEDRRRHLTQLARVLPRADQLFAQPRQRFDNWAERLPKALQRNLQEHRRAFAEAAALLRPKPISTHIGVCGERTELLGHRLARSQTARLAEARRHVDALGRVLEGLSYRSALDRGFALVRGADGAIRRRAGQVASGEGLSLTFADGEVGAVATGTPPKPKSRGKPSGGQGSLF